MKGLGEDSELEFYSVQACRYVMGKYFSDLGAKPESFSDLELRRYLPAVYNLLQEAKDWLDWDPFLRAFASIPREGWKVERRKINTLPYEEDIIESDLDHLILGSCLVAHVYDPNKRGLTDENRIQRTRAMLMFLLHETDELVIGDMRPNEPGYKEKKKMAIPKARTLLKEQYHAHPTLLALWDEFNAGETALARDIDFLDHEVAILRANRYDKEFDIGSSPLLAREFVSYYQEKHSDHPDVGVLQRYMLENQMRFLPGHYNYSARSWIKMLRETWTENKLIGDSIEPETITRLSCRILDRFSAILPE